MWRKSVAQANDPGGIALNVNSKNALACLGTD